MRFALALGLMFGISFGATAAKTPKPSDYDQTQDTTIGGFAGHDAQEKSIGAVVQTMDRHDAAIGVLVPKVDGLETDIADLKVATPTMPAGTATRRWVNSNFATLPVDFDFATMYVAAGLDETAARCRLADTLNAVRASSKPAVFLDIAMAVMTDAITIAREHAAPTEAQILAIVGPLLDAKADKDATEELAGRMETAECEVGALSQNALARLDDLHSLLESGESAVGDLTDRLDALESTPPKTDHHDAAGLDEDAVQVIVDAAVKPVGDRLITVERRQGKIEDAFVAVTRALATNDPENGEGKRNIQVAAGHAVGALGHKIKP